MSAPCPDTRRGGGHLGRSLASLAIATLVVAATGIGAAAQTSRAGAARTVLITVDGTSIQDWRRAGAFTSFEAVSLLATRTHAPDDDPRTLRASAYASLGAGTAAELRAAALPTKAGDGVLAGALGEALARRGLLSAAFGDASGTDEADAPAALGAMRADGTVAVSPGERRAANAAGGPASRPDENAPTGRRSDYRALGDAVRGALDWATFIVVDLGDTARADRVYPEDPGARTPWIDRALRDADSFASGVRAMLGPVDMLMVAALVPPMDRADHGRHLAAFASTGRRGLATSGTTRRSGVVSLTDIAPTVVRRAGVPLPAEMTGRAVTVKPHTTARTAATQLDAAFVRALSSRTLMTRSWLGVAAALAILSFLTIVSGRGRRGSGRVPRTWRDLLANGLLATTAAPGAMLIAPALPGDTVVSLAVWTAVLAFGGALGARTVFGGERGLLAVALAVTGILVGDLIAGSPLGSRSPIAFQIAGGGRFYGIDEAILGVFLAAALIAAGIGIDRARDRRRAFAVATTALFVVAFAASAPTLGSKFGAPFTLVPAFGAFAVLARGRHIDREALIGIATATILLASALAAADALGSPESRSHIGRELAGGTATGPLIVRKISSLARVTFTTIWLPFTIVVAGSAAFLLVRRHDLVARAFWVRPAQRSALISLAAGSVLGLVSNDTGIMTAAAASATAAAAFYEPFLVAPASPPVRGRGALPRIDDS